MRRPTGCPDPSQRRQVEAMAGYGIPDADIALVLDIDLRTLREHYCAELDTGHIVANAKVAESLFRKATGDHRQSVTAAIFWLKTRARWREATAEESGRDPVQAQIESMSDAELARRIAFLNRLIEEQRQETGAELSPSGESPADDRQSAPGL